MLTRVLSLQRGLSTLRRLDLADSTEEPATPTFEQREEKFGVRLERRRAELLAEDPGATAQPSLLVPLLRGEEALDNEVDLERSGSSGTTEAPDCSAMESRAFDESRPMFTLASELPGPHLSRLRRLLARLAPAPTWVSPRHQYRWPTGREYAPLACLAQHA